MADFTVVYALIGSSIVQAILLVIAAYYAYRVTKVVGLFWAWGCIVLAFAINAARGIMSVVSIFFVPLDQLNSLLAQFSSLSIWSGEVVNIAGAVLLAIGMYGLLQIFGRRSVLEAQQRA